MKKLCLFTLAFVGISLFSQNYQAVGGKISDIETQFALMNAKVAVTWEAS